jgi:hypothetical protein
VVKISEYKENTNLEHILDFVTLWCIAQSGKQSDVSRSAIEAEFDILLDAMTELELLQHLVHFLYKVDKRNFNVKKRRENTSAGAIVNSMERCS